jgi:hypothetical protein
MTISVLPNETSGTFTSIPLTRADPWQLPSSATITMNAYDWLGVGTTLANIIRHIQIKVTMSASDTVKNEIYTLSLV